MCGINGFEFFKNSEKDLNEKLINEMNGRIYHRGPDDNGNYTDSHMAIGMTRLSIIDLSTGKQPITNEDGTLKIVFNGEIYNYRDIRKTLLEKGHIFHTESDTEVVLHAFEEYGKDCTNVLKGMFAFAIYNLNDGSLFLARDRIGEKPLYYTKTENAFIFASELKSIFSTNLIEKRINKTAFAQYLMLTYIPAPLTILENVYKLPAAHYMTVSEAGEIETAPYWDVVYNEKDKITDYDECKRVLRKTLFDAVEHCMVSDVPIGAFLSGGIDSTIITGIMSSISDAPVNTFTIGFRDKNYDESDRAALASKQHRTNHHVYFIDYKNMLNNIDRLLANMDEPFADSSLIPTYTVSQLARQEVKVVLTGDAGDELFAGYDKYLIGYYSDLYNKLPRLMRKGVIEPAVRLLPANHALVRKANKVIENSRADIFTQRRNLMCLGAKCDTINQLLRYDGSDALNFIRAYYDRYADSACEVDRTLYTDLKVVLEGDMLFKVDRASMLASLETRVPVLYPDVVELAAKIPADFKIKSGNKKIILKETFSDLIPEKLLTAPKKGFSVPMADWLKNELREELTTALDPVILEKQGLLNPDYVQLLLQEHLSGKRNHNGILWAIYVFEKWYANYFES